MDAAPTTHSTALAIRKYGITTRRSQSTQFVMISFMRSNQLISSSPVRQRSQKDCDSSTQYWRASWANSSIHRFFHENALTHA